VNRRLREELKNELLARGFSRDGVSPKSTIAIGDAYLTATDMASLLETMVERREKVFRSVGVVGKKQAKAAYEDVVIAIEAIKAVIGKFLPL